MSVSQPLVKRPVIAYADKPPPRGIGVKSEGGRLTKSFQVVTWVFLGSIKTMYRRVLAAAVHGGRGTYLRTDLLEARRLNSDAARLLHHRLHWINTGCRRDVSLDKMIGYVWSSEEVSASAYRTRRQVLKRALGQLIAIGWSVTSRGDLFHIGRPAAQGNRAMVTL